MIRAWHSAVEQELVGLASERCDVHGVKARFIEANATQVAELLAGERFDFVIFFATLEHMTHEERLIAMGNTWAMLAPGALWVVVETPNQPRTTLKGRFQMLLSRISPNVHPAFFEPWLNLILRKT